MRVVVMFALLYGLAVAGATPAATPAAAQTLSPQDRAQIADMRTGEMSKLVIRDEPWPMPEAGFQTKYGHARHYRDWAGKVLVVNFWATWCAPCREEMPSLDRLQAALGGDEFQVLAINNERNGYKRAEMFLKEIGVEHLDPYVDADQELGRKSAILGLPATLILDREGREIARMTGDARWDSPEAIALLKAVIEATRPHGA